MVNWIKINAELINQKIWNKQKDENDIVWETQIEIIKAMNTNGFIDPELLENIDQTSEIISEKDKFLLFFRSMLASNGIHLIIDPIIERVYDGTNAKVIIHEKKITLQINIQRSTSKTLMHEVFEVLFQHLSTESQSIAIFQQSYTEKEIKDVICRYPEYVWDLLELKREARADQMVSMFMNLYKSGDVNQQSMIDRKNSINSALWAIVENINAENLMWKRIEVASKELLSPQHVSIDVSNTDEVVVNWEEYVVASYAGKLSSVAWTVDTVAKDFYEWINEQTLGERDYIEKGWYTWGSRRVNLLRKGLRERFLVEKRYNTIDVTWKKDIEVDGKEYVVLSMSWKPSTYKKRANYIINEFKERVIGKELAEWEYLEEWWRSRWHVVWLVAKEVWKWFELDSGIREIDVKWKENVVIEWINYYILHEKWLRKEFWWPDIISEFSIWVRSQEIDPLEYLQSWWRVWKRKVALCTKSLLNQFRNELRNDFNEDLQKAEEIIKSHNIERSFLMGLAKSDPKYIEYYILLNNPELTWVEVKTLVRATFRWLKWSTAYTREEQYLDYNEETGFDMSKELLISDNAGNQITISDIAVEYETETSYLFLKCIPPEGYKLVINWIITYFGKSGKNENVQIPLKCGRENELRCMYVNTTLKTRSPQLKLYILHTGEDTEARERLIYISKFQTTQIEEMKTDERKRTLLKEMIVDLSFKKFQNSFFQWLLFLRTYRTNLKEYIEQGWDVLFFQWIIDEIIQEFTEINNIIVPSLRAWVELFWHQKYALSCLLKSHDSMRDENVSMDRDLGGGILNVLWTGLGKTLVGLSFISILKKRYADRRFIIIAPNQVISTWIAEYQNFFEDQDMLVLAHWISMSKRKDMLREGIDSGIILTNYEFLQNTQDNERYQLLNSTGKNIVLIDEAHKLTNLWSQQSRGAQALKGDFFVWSTATPWYTPNKVAALLHQIVRNEKLFEDPAQLSVSINNNPSWLIRFHYILTKYMLRLRKEDVMETVDKRLPLEEQIGKLPLAIHEPLDYSSYELDDEQSLTILQMFINRWERESLAKRSLSKKKDLWIWQNNTSLSKRHTYSQICNNPWLIYGSGVWEDEFKNIIKNLNDNKLYKCIELVDKYMQEWRKVIIVCEYLSQTQKYRDALNLKWIWTSVYTWDIVKMWNVMDDDQKLLYFKQRLENWSVKWWELDKNWYPIPREGQWNIPNNYATMTYKDYEHLTFQYASDIRVLIMTGDAWWIGVNFTAWKAMILDWLPKSYIDLEQRLGRILRITKPEHHTHYDVKYAYLNARYSERFLEQMKWVRIKKQPDGTYEIKKHTDESYKYIRWQSEVDDLLLNERTTAYEEFFKQWTLDWNRIRNLRAQQADFDLMVNWMLEDENDIYNSDRRLQGMK